MNCILLSVLNSSVTYSKSEGFDFWTTVFHGTCYHLGVLTLKSYSHGQMPFANKTFGNKGGRKGGRAAESVRILQLVRALVGKWNKDNNPNYSQFIIN